MTLWALAAMVVLTLPEQAEPDTGYFDWMAVAPIVVSARHIGQDGKYTEFTVNHVVKGDLREGSTLRTLVRRANRERSPNSSAPPLRMDEGTDYLLLLERLPEDPSRERPTFALVRGVRGARELPAEGASSLLGVLERFAEIQQHKDDAYTWRAMREMLDEAHPLLVETGLEQFIKFRRGTPEMVPSLEPLLDHPAPDLRERAARLLAQVLPRAADSAVVDLTPVRGALIGRARRDASVRVRVAASEALAALDGPAIDATLQEIADDDPDQLVRYAAQLLLLERRDEVPASALDSGHPGPD